METKTHTLHLGNKHLEARWVEIPKDDERHEDLAYSGTLYPRGEGHLKKVSPGKYNFKPWCVGGVIFGYDGHTNNPYLPFSEVYRSSYIPGRTADERKQWLVRNGFIK